MKKKAWWLGIIAIAIGIAIMLFPKFQGERQAASRFVEVQKQQAAAREALEALQKVAPTEAPRYGYFMVTCERKPDGTKVFNGVDAPPGDNVVVCPTADVSYQACHANRPDVIRTIPAGNPGAKVTHNDTNMTDMVFWLLEGQGIVTIPFVYCRYQTDQPPKGWYGHAVKTLRNRKS